MLGREAFEHRVCVLRIADLERPVRLVRPAPVEDEHAARALHGDEAGELVAQLTQVGVTPRVEQVVPVEQVERRLSHVAVSLRRGAMPPPR